MKINDNVPALQAYTSLTLTNRKIDSAMQKLASGTRINSVRDDAAGLAIANKMKAQIRGIDMANRNALDGVSMVQTAEGALQEVHNMLHRMKELAVQASNATNEPDDREKLNMEVELLLKEINDTSYKTEYNNIKILNGDAAKLGKVTNISDRAVASISYISDNVETGCMAYEINSYGLPASVISNGGIPASADLSSYVGQSITINGESFEVETNDTTETVIKKFQKLCDSANLNLELLGGNWDDFQNDNNTSMIIFSKEAGISQTIDISGSTGLLSAFGLSATSVSGTNAVVSGATLNGESFSTSVEGNRIELIGSNNKNIVIDLKISGPDIDGNFTAAGDKIFADGSGAPMGGSRTINAEILDYGTIKLQIGANYNMQMDVQIPSVSAKGLGIEFLNVKSTLGAQKALELVDKASSKVSEIRSKLGACQNCLEHTAMGLDVASENTSISLSRILDTDMAWEMTVLTQSNVAMQAGMSILAQANQRPQQILQLLNK